MQRILFICSQNQDRSKTAEDICQDMENVTAKSAGLHAGTPVTETALQWADQVVVFTTRQKHELCHRFPSLDPEQVWNFDIVAGLPRGNEKLVAMIREQFQEHDLPAPPIT